MATMLDEIVQFERDLLSGRAKYGVAAVRARGKKLGSQYGQRPKSGKRTPKVVQAVAEGRSYGFIARDLASAKTVLEILKGHSENSLDIITPRLGTTPSMAVTKMGGNVFASVLTLVAVPVLYALLFGIRPPKGEKAGTIS